MSEISISVESHAKTSFETMNNLRKCNTLCDVTLNVEGHKFPVHRIVLAARSDYFCAMFTNEMSEKHQSEITLHNISASIMDDVLDFCYTETVTLTEDNVQELLLTACLLQLYGLRQMCCTFFNGQLDNSNCLGIRAFADRMTCTSLYASADHYCMRHFIDVVKQDEFKLLPGGEIEALIENDLLQINSEQPVYDAVLDWVKCEEKRLSWLPSLLSCVRLPLLSPTFITDVIDNEPLIRASHECRDLVDVAKKYHLRPDLRPQMIGPLFCARAGEHSRVNQMMSARSLLLHRYELLLCQSLPWCRRYVTAVSVAGRVYVIGGYDGHSRLKTVECLDLTVPKPDWCPITPMYRRRGLACSCVHNEFIYVGGGFDGHTRHASVEKYDISLDKWTLLGDMAVGREGACLVVSGGAIYCVGGYDGSNLLSSIERYNLSTERWTSLPCMGTPRSGAGVAALGDIIYVCGGYDGDKHLSSVEIFHTHTEQWTAVHSMVVPRCYVGSGVVRSTLMVVAGYDGDDLLGTVEVYDPVQDNWQLMDGSMSIARCDAGICVVRMP